MRFVYTSPFRTLSPLRVQQRALSLRTTRRESSSIKRHPLALLRPSQTMEVIPRLRDLRSPIIHRALTRIRLIIPWSAAAHIWQLAVPLRQCILHIAQRDASAVARSDSRVLKPGVRRQAEIVHNSRLEEINQLLVLDVLRSITWYIKRTEARRVFSKLVSPEFVVGAALIDPVLVHPSNQIVLPKWGDEFFDCRSRPRWDDSTVG